MLLGGQIIGCLFLMNSREIFEVLYINFRMLLERQGDSPDSLLGPPLTKAAPRRD